jgi:hypothetical protein
MRDTRGVSAIEVAKEAFELLHVEFRAGKFDGG